MAVWLVPRNVVVRGYTGAGNKIRQIWEGSFKKKYGNMKRVAVHTQVLHPISEEIVRGGRGGSKRLVKPVPYCI